MQTPMLETASAVDLTSALAPLKLALTEPEVDVVYEAAVTTSKLAVQPHSAPAVCQDRELVESLASVLDPAHAVSMDCRVASAQALSSVCARSDGRATFIIAMAARPILEWIAAMLRKQYDTTTHFLRIYLYVPIVCVRGRLLLCALLMVCCCQADSYSQRFEGQRDRWNDFCSIICAHQDSSH